MARPTSLFGSADLPGLGLALLLAALGAGIALVPGGDEPVSLLLWLSLWALPAGVLAGGSGLRLWPLGVCVPAGWTLAVTLADAASERDLPTPLHAALVLTGLFLGGWAVGGAVRARRARGTPVPVATARAAGIALVVASLSFFAPLGGLRLDPAGSPRVRARLLDLSVASLVVESAGVDWLRHPTVYRWAGSADLDPALRRPYRGLLAGAVTLLVGCVLALSSWLGGRRSLRSVPPDAPGA